MPNNFDAVDREEDDLVRAYNNGEMSQAEFNESMRELRDSVRGAYEQDCADAQHQVDLEYGH